MPEASGEVERRPRRVSAPPMSRAAALAALWAFLDVAHDVGDHVLQTDRQALGKASPDRRAWVPAMAGHVVGYHLAQVAAVVAADRLLGLRLRPARIAAAMALSASTHALLDRRWPVRRLMQATGSAGFARGTFTIEGSRVPTGGAEPLDEDQLRVPLNGPYLADQALHRACLLLAAVVATSAVPR